MRSGGLEPTSGSVAGRRTGVAPAPRVRWLPHSGGRDRRSRQYSSNWQNLRVTFKQLAHARPKDAVDALAASAH